MIAVRGSGRLAQALGLRMTPWFIATERFSPEDAGWGKYMAWSKLTQLDEVVSLDPMLCPPILRNIEDEYWPHIVNEDFMLNYFTDLDYLISKVAGVERKNLLCVYRNPGKQPIAPTPLFEFLGYDLVDTLGSASALTNCGGFPEVFSNSELSSKGLLLSHERAAQVQSELRRTGLDHSDCHLWAIFRAAGP